MYKYNVKIQKVSGSLNESAMPSKNLVVKSKNKKTDKEVFAEASKFYKEKYGLVIESADVSSENPMKQKFMTMYEEKGLRYMRDMLSMSVSRKRLTFDEALAILKEIESIDKEKGGTPDYYYYE